jgi:hypothetical protein
MTEKLMANCDQLKKQLCEFTVIIHGEFRRHRRHEWTENPRRPGYDPSESDG